MHTILLFSISEETLLDYRLAEADISGMIAVIELSIDVLRFTPQVSPIKGYKGAGDDPSKWSLS